MRSFILLALTVIVTFVSAIPITPSAPHWQRKAEQFRLEGMREFDIAERLTSPATSLASESQPFFSRLIHKLHIYIYTPSTDDEPDLSGDVAPGSAEAPQMLPKAPSDDERSLFESLSALFHRHESSFGYEGKELEMRRPTGMVHWKQTLGGFRR